MSRTDNATIAACITSRYMDIVSAGVPAPVLLARAACAGAAFPFPPPLPTPAATTSPSPSTLNGSAPALPPPPSPPPPACPVKFALSFFGAPLACANASTYCTDCVNALTLPMAAAGARPREGPRRFSRACCVSRC